jgi:hypothetical protein
MEFSLQYPQQAPSNIWIFRYLSRCAAWYDHSYYSPYIYTETGKMWICRKLEEMLLNDRLRRRPNQSCGGRLWTAKIPGCNKLWSICAADVRGPVLSDASEQSARPPVPRARKGNMAKDILEGCRGKAQDWDNKVPCRIDGQR